MCTWVEKHKFNKSLYLNKNAWTSKDHKGMRNCTNICDEILIRH